MGHCYDTLIWYLVPNAEIPFIHNDLFIYTMRYTIFKINYNLCHQWHYCRSKQMWPVVQKGPELVVHREIRHLLKL